MVLLILLLIEYLILLSNTSFTNFLIYCEEFKLFESCDSNYFFFQEKEFNKTIKHDMSNYLLERRRRNAAKICPENFKIITQHISYIAEILSQFTFDLTLDDFVQKYHANRESDMFDSFFDSSITLDLNTEMVVDGNEENKEETLSIKQKKKLLLKAFDNLYF